MLIKPDGTLIQSHYSGMSKYDGLASGDFRQWLGKSQYKAQNVMLYLLPDA